MQCVSIALVCLLLFACGPDGDGPAADIPPPLEDVLTLELSFGDTGLPEEYLLVRPWIVKVNYNGDILVTDESSIKVYDSTGVPKHIIGRRGQGPEEYDGMAMVSANNTDYITGIDSGENARYHLYTKDYEYIHTRSLIYSDLHETLMSEHEHWREIVYNAIYFFTPKEYMIITQIFGQRDLIPQSDYRAVIHVQDTIFDIVALEREPDFEDGMYLSAIGSIEAFPLTGKRFVFANPGRDFEQTESGWFYSFRVIDAETGDSKAIQHRYDPVEIPDSVIYREPYSREGMSESRRQQEIERAQKRTERLKKLRYYAPYQKIIADGGIVFVYTFRSEAGKGWLVDVFDTVSGEYLSSVYFPYSFYIICDGFGYRLNDFRKKGTFPAVEKYRIDPAVYGKSDRN